MKLVFPVFLVGFILLLGSDAFTQDTLKVLSYNIEGMKPGTNPGLRLGFIIAELKALDPDIIALQEINQAVSGNGNDNQGQKIADVLSDYFGVEYHYYQQFTHLSWDNKFREYIGIVSKYPILAEGNSQLATGAFPRKIIWNMIDTPLGKINFFSTHLSYNSQTVRLTQVKQINTYVKQIEAANDAINSIVCGDFNDTPTAPSISYLLSSQDLTYFDSYHVVHPNASGFTIPSNNPNAKIDYVFYTHQNELIPASSETVMDGMIVNNLYRSDHLGVMTQFVFSPNATTELESREFKILDGFTNPYLSNSPIEFELYSPSQVNVNLYNSAGQKLKLLLSKRMGAGRHQVSFDATHLAGQFLFVKIEISGRVETVRLVTLP